MTNHRKVFVSVMLGLAGFGASFLSPAFQFPPHTISITWCHIFPLIAAMAYGPRYGLIAAVFGLTMFHPFFSWPNGGWSNVVPMIFTAVFYWWHGFAAQARRKKPAPWNQPFVAQIPYAIAYGAAIFLLYPWLISLN